MKSLRENIESKVEQDLETKANSPKEVAAKVVNDRISPFEMEYNEKFKLNN